MPKERSVRDSLRFLDTFLVSQARFSHAIGFGLLDDSAGTCLPILALLVAEPHTIEVERRIAKDS